MITVSMTRADWDFVVMALREVKDREIFSYFDHIIDTIDYALDTQEN